MGESTTRALLSSTEAGLQSDAQITPPADVEAQAKAIRALPFYAHRRRLLVGAFVVLFLRYCVATFLSSFFTQVATDMGISGTFNGLIFAGYPFGMAITSMVAPKLIQKVGTRTSVVFGLVCTAVFNLLFGLAPDFSGEGLGSAAVNKWLFLLLYFCNGLTGALAETSCLVMIARYFQDHIGVVMAASGTVSGVGCMLGPVVGGGLYSAVSDPRWAFRTPFFACSVLPLLLLPAVRLFMPQEWVRGDDAKPTSPFAILSASVVLGLCSVAFSGTVVATLDPTLSYRLSAPPFLFSPSLVSLFFTYSSIVYVVVSIPVGRIVDRYPGDSRVFKLTTAAGFVVLALTFALLAPLQPSTFGIDGSPLGATLNKLPCVAAAMALKGVGSAFSNNAVYPDLIIGLPADDAVLQATVSGLWNAAYAIGWAGGPLVGGVLYDAFRSHTLCLSQGGGGCEEKGGCSCEWEADNGFDGFGSVTALLSFLYALLLLLAAALNVRGPPICRPQGPDDPLKPLDAGALDHSSGDGDGSPLPAALHAISRLSPAASPRGSMSR
jgi:MFS family permease